MIVTTRGAGENTFVKVNDIIRQIYRDASITSDPNVRRELSYLADRIEQLKY